MRWAVIGETGLFGSEMAQLLEEARDLDRIIKSCQFNFWKLNFFVLSFLDFFS
jgi:hypothetical protein